MNSIIKRRGEVVDAVSVQLSADRRGSPESQSMRLLMVWDFITDWDFRIPDWKRSRTVSGIPRWNLSCNKVKYDKRIKKRGYAVRAMDYIISSTNITVIWPVIHWG